MISLSGFLEPHAAPSLRERRRLMTAAVMVAPGRFEHRRLTLPRPGPGEVRVRLEGSGVSALPTPLSCPLPPGEPGCEGWGRVEAIGCGVHEWSVGDRVALTSPGSYASHRVVPVDQLVEIPPDVPFPAPLLAGVVNLFRRSGIGEGERVAILGAGFSGLLLTQLAVLARARVAVISRRPYALALARKFGAEWTLPLHPLDSAVRALRDWSDGLFCDLAIEMTGHQCPLTLAPRLLKPGGRLLIGGTQRAGPRRVDLGLWQERGIHLIPSSPGGPAQRRDCLREAAAALRTGLMTPVYTHCFGPERLEEAHRMASRRPDGFLKAWVHFPPSPA